MPTDRDDTKGAMSGAADRDAETDGQTLRETPSGPITNREPFGRENPRSSLWEAARGKPAGARPEETDSIQRRLPSALEQDYEVVRLFPTKGAEADIVLVKGRPNRELAIAKIYRPGIAPNSFILEQLLETDPAFVIRLIKCGESDGQWYEIQEYAAEGSLEDLLATDGSLAPEQAKRVLAQINASLAYLHGLTPAVVHRDIKPSNVLVRRREPLEVALADFGIATNLDFTSKFTKAHRTICYAPPEGEKGLASPRFDYWSLEIVMTELLMGKEPVRRPIDGANRHWSRRQDACRHSSDLGLSRVP